MINTPKIRFKKYTESWTLKEFNRIFKERHQLGNISDDYPQLSFTIAEGVINPEDRKTNNRDFLIIDKANKKYLRTEYNDIIYNPANVIYGAIHRNKLKKGVVSPIYRIFESYENPVYMECIVRNPKFINQVARRTEGTVTKLKTLKPDAFLAMESYVSPIKEEQEKIGSLLEKIDKLIKIQNQKIDNYIVIKKNLLNKMFPNEKSEVPEIRFKGFYNDWSKYKFNQLGEYFNTSNLGYSDLDVNGEKKCLLYGELYTKYQERIFNVESKTNKNGTLLKKGDILFPTSTTVDAISLISPSAVDEDDVIAGGDLFGIRPYENINGIFISYCINNKQEIKNNFAKNAQGLTIVHLHYKCVENETICVPNKEEQDKMVELFIKLDNLIRLQQCKLDSLKKTKMSLLDKMFV